jgi:hypothetical protein
MICPNCNRSCLAADFMKNQTVCYKCSYEMKKLGIEQKNEDLGHLCKVCGNKIILDKNAKKKQRSVYCSEDCALKGHKCVNSNYWTRKFREAHPLKSRFYA